MTDKTHTRSFRWITDNEIGLTGWLLTSMPHFDPVRGFGMAHDLLEHFGEYPGIEGEALAFGCMIWQRGEGGYWDEQDSRYNRPPRTTREHCVDLADECYQFLVDNQFKIAEPESCEELAPEVEDYLAGLVEGITAAWQYNSAAGLDEPPEWADIEASVDRFARWVRLGYSRAPERWTCGPESLAATFLDMEMAIDLLSESREHDDEIEVSVEEGTGKWGYTVIQGADLDGIYHFPGEDDEESSDESSDE